VRQIRLRILLSRVLDLLLRRRRERRLADEIQSHLDQLTDEYMASGLSHAEARNAARRTFGGVDQIKERYRDQRGLPGVDSLLQDLRFGARLLLKERSFTAGAILVLGLGLGVNTTIFTIINGMSWRGLPVPRADQILQVTSQRQQGDRQQMYTSVADFRDWQAATQTFSALAIYGGGSMNIGDTGQPADRVGGSFISANAFSVLGVRPLLGRDFSSADDAQGAEPVAILSHGLWRSRYGGDDNIVGRTIRINGTATTVVGVMPDGFEFPLRAAVWQPASQRPGFNAQKRDHRTFDVFGRLRDTATIEQARAEFTAVTAALAAAHPATNGTVGVRIVPFTESYVGPPTEGPPLLMITAGILVLLIACANAANLLLARAMHRTREVALRAALGASRARIVRQLLIESIMLSTAAAAAGLLFAVAGVRVFAAETIDLNLPYWIQFEFDARVFAYVAGISVVTAIVFGSAPAWHLSSTRARDALKEGGRGTTGSVRSQRWAAGLLVAELAVTLTILAGASVVLRTGQRLYEADAVLDLDNLITGQLAVPPSAFATPEQRRAFLVQAQERLDRAPGLAAATLASARPFVDSNTHYVVVEGQAVTIPPIVQTVAIGDRYFETLQLPLLRGRSLESSDGLATAGAVVINERFASLHFPDRDPLGARLQLNETAEGSSLSQWHTIVGVSPSVRQRPMGDVAAVVYLPLLAEPGTLVSVVVRGASEHINVAEVLREELRAVNADAAAYNVEALARLSAKSRWPVRVLSAVLFIVAAIATLLAAMGLYGVTSYGVSQRTSEIGIRVALGATRSEVAWLFLRRTFMQVGLGLLIGTAGAVALGEVLRGVIPRTATADPLVLGVIVALLIVVAAAACFFPTRRAVRLDPVSALRHE